MSSKSGEFAREQVEAVKRARALGKPFGLSARTVLMEQLLLAANEEFPQDPARHLVHQLMKPVGGILDWPGWGMSNEEFVRENEKEQTP